MFMAKVYLRLTNGTTKKLYVSEFTFRDNENPVNMEIYVPDMDNGLKSLGNIDTAILVGGETTCSYISEGPNAPNIEKLAGLLLRAKWKPADFSYLDEEPVAEKKSADIPKSAIEIESVFDLNQANRLKQQTTVGQLMRDLRARIEQRGGITFYGSGKNKQNYFIVVGTSIVNFATYKDGVFKILALDYEEFISTIENINNRGSRLGPMIIGKVDKNGTFVNQGDAIFGLGLKVK